MNTAKLLKDNLKGFHGRAALYAMTPPHEGHDFVVASAVDDGRVHETYMFGADAEGNVTDWLELEGSQKGTVSHEYVLARAGYAVEDSSDAQA